MTRSAPLANAMPACIVDEGVRDVWQNTNVLNTSGFLSNSADGMLKPAAEFSQRHFASAFNRRKMHNGVLQCGACALHVDAAVLARCGSVRPQNNVLHFRAKFTKNGASGFSGPRALELNGVGIASALIFEDGLE